MGVATKAKLPQRSQHQSPPHALHARPVLLDFDIPRCRMAILRSSNMAGNAPTNGGLSWTIIRKLGIVHGKTHHGGVTQKKPYHHVTLSCGHSKKLFLLPSIFFDLLLPAFQALWIRSPRNIGQKVNDQQAYEHCVCALFAETLPSETAKQRNHG